MKEKFINAELKEEYNNRLNQTLHGKDITFRSQIDGGRGSELKERTKDGKKIEPKFWSTISSSRLCFDLYSWIANEHECIDFSFEKPLEGIRSGNSCTKSYMDVYVRTRDNNIWFIESKFTEKSQNISKLPGAYYQTLDEKGNEITADYGTDTYYHLSSGDKLGKHSLLYRFSEKEQVIAPFVGFVNYIRSKKESSQWFDTKQETCHLLGIIMYVLKNGEKLKNCHIHFRNIVYNKTGSNDYISDDVLANDFMQEATDMIRGVFKTYGITDVSFDYSALSVQDVLSAYGDRKSFGSDNSVKKTICNNFKGYF